jgi:bacillithiol biosynthesis cysteine-adding enzyme BshC
LATFYSSYLASGLRASALLPRGFGSDVDRRAAVTFAARRRVAPELLAELERQNDAYPPSPAREAHLEALGSPGTVVVATGQQVGLFLGPLYTLYKAASAVAVARLLAAETGVRAVPLFWLQTEDHDFVEMAGCSVPRDREAPLRLALSERPGDERVALADRVLGPEVRDVLARLDEALAGLPHREGVLALLSAHYRPGVPPGRAFAGVLAALFAQAGLVIYDPRQATAARLLEPVMRAALTSADRLEALLVERGRLLADSGFAEQIQLRRGSPLCFVHDGPRGPRQRLVRRGAGLGAPGEPGALSIAELVATLEREPLRFSTSALLRPIAQDTLFPTAAYVGGPAEVAYFAQLAPLYPAFGLEAPLVVPRSRFRLLTPRLAAILSRLGLTAADLDTPRDALISRLAPHTRLHAADASPRRDWAAELDARLGALEQRAAALDPALERATRGTRASLARSLDRLARRYERLAVDRDQVLRSRLERLERWLHPDGAPQERVFSFPWFAARAGTAALVSAVLEAVDPLSPAPRDLTI